MITDLHYSGSDGIILSAELDNVEKQLRFGDLHPFWEYATEEDLEGGTAKIYDNKVLFTMFTASTQGGIVVLWNVETGKIEHISDGSYTLAVDMDQQYIYVLFDVFNYVTKANLQLWRVPIGCMDPCNKGEKMVAPHLPSADFFIDDYNHFKLSKRDTEFEIEIQGQVYTIAVK